MSSNVALALRQVRYENLAFWRNPPAAFFTIAFPLMFLVIFNLAFGNETVRLSGEETRASTFIIPAIVAFGVISACYTNIAMSITFSREQGVLKRVRGTPLPAWAFISARVAHAVLLAVLLVVIVVLAGALFYGVDVPTTTMPAFLVTLVIGAGAFCALGAAISVVIPNADAAPAVVNFSILPLLFISNVFIRIEDPPAWMGALRNIFPVYHFFEALQRSFNPFATGSGFEWGHLAVMAAWGAAGLLIAARYFSWEPHH
ncbi:MAG: ABC transporter permease [Actinomycetota bacterium]